MRSRVIQGCDREKKLCGCSVWPRNVGRKHSPLTCCEGPGAPRCNAVRCWRTQLLAWFCKIRQLACLIPQDPFKQPLRLSLQVLAPYDVEDARGLLKAAIRDPDPVVFLENEMMYGTSFDVTSQARGADVMRLLLDVGSLIAS